MGTEAFGMDGDLAYDSGSFMSPPQFREFVKPYYIEIVNAARRHNIPIVKHSDGDLRPILPDIVDAGFDGIHPIQPQCMDLAEIKREYGNRSASWATWTACTCSPGAPRPRSWPT